MDINIPSGINIFYGTNTKNIDITNIFFNQFCQKDKCIIPKNTIFNELFGDPLPNQIKNVIIIKDHIIIQKISENQPNEGDIHIKLF